MRTAIRILLGLVAGVLIGAFGTAIHRTLIGNFTLHDAVGRGFPVGLLVALALLVSAGLFIRAAAGFNMFAAFGIGWILMVWLFSIPNHGGDVLIVDPRESIPWAVAGLIWTYLGTLLLVIIALLPLRWFSPKAGGHTGGAVPDGAAGPDGVSRHSALGALVTQTQNPENRDGAVEVSRD